MTTVSADAVALVLLSVGFVAWSWNSYMPQEREVHSIGLPHVRIPIEQFRFALMVIPNTLKGLWRFVMRMLKSPFGLRKFFRRFKAAWDLTKQGTDTTRFVYLKKGANTFTDKELSDVVRTGLNIAKQSHPYSMTSKDVIQFQKKADNNLAYLKGGKWTNHTGETLVELKNDGQFSQTNRSENNQNKKNNDNSRKQRLADDRLKKQNQENTTIKGETVEQASDKVRNRDKSKDVFL